MGDESLGYFGYHSTAICEATIIWRCPACRGQLIETGMRVVCAVCRATYDVVSGIPDLRIIAPVWIDCDEDRDHARRIAEETVGWDIEKVVSHVFRVVRGRKAANVAFRTQMAVEAPRRMRREILGWLNDATNAVPFLDLGCGSGALLAAASAEGRVGIGLDVSMVWLVVAQRFIEAAGGTPVLAAGFAESLPLADGAVNGVVSLDVIEHVGDQVAYLREIDRVTAPGGILALATPNRFSLGPEPHVRVWGVGWLPRPMQQRYAERRSGMSYAFTRLLSARETGKLLRLNTSFDSDFLVPMIPDEEIVLASGSRARLSRIYNRVVGLAWTRAAMLAVGAFFRVVGKKSSRAPANSSRRYRKPDLEQSAYRR